MKYASTTIENDGTTYPDQTGWALYVIKRILDCFFAADALNDAPYWSLDSTKTAGQYDYKGFNYIYNLNQSSISTPALCAFLTGSGGEHLCIFAVCGATVLDKSALNVTDTYKHLCLSFSNALSGYLKRGIVPGSIGMAYSYDNFTIADTNVQTIKSLQCTENSVLNAFDGCSANASKSSSSSPESKSYIYTEYNKVNATKLYIGIEKNNIVSLLSPTNYTQYKIGITGTILGTSPVGITEQLSSIFFPCWNGSDIYNAVNSNSQTSNMCCDYVSGLGYSSIEGYYNEGHTVYFPDTIIKVHNNNATNPVYIYTSLGITGAGSSSGVINNFGGVGFVGFIKESLIRVLGVPRGADETRYKLFNGGKFCMIQNIDTSKRLVIVIAWDASNPIPT